jgi:hypothetical protein
MTNAPIHCLAAVHDMAVMLVWSSSGGRGPAPAAPARGSAFLGELQSVVADWRYWTDYCSGIITIAVGTQGRRQKMFEILSVGTSSLWTTG